MPDRKMFWRIVRRLFVAQRGRLLVVLLALGAGAALTAALLNIQVDAKSRLTKEFRTFGRNVIVSPRIAVGSTPSAVMDQALASHVAEFSTTHGMASGTAYLYFIGEVFSKTSGRSVPAVISGARVKIFGSVPMDGDPIDKSSCLIGPKVAEQLKLQAGDKLRIRKSGNEITCGSVMAPLLGDEQDSQVMVNLDDAQRLAGLPGKISLMQLSVTGTPKEISEYIAALAKEIPSADVHGLRQFTDAEAKIYNRISGLLTATVALVLALTALCVMAAMTNVAMERKNDVGLMRAIGGATRRVLRLFLAEAALLGLVGGLVGAAVGIVFSIWLGQTVFGVAARPRLIVYPVSVALTIFVALISAYPLRRLANISPASIFRGEA
jgi:putative ABC transport system permease protein